MSYCRYKTVPWKFQEAIDHVKSALQDEGFGILMEIDVKDTLKKKLDVDFPEYRILGACNPPFAYRALQAEERIGLMLPCNVIIRELPTGVVEVAAIDPVASMQSIKNPELGNVANDIKEKLQRVIKNL